MLQLALECAIRAALIALGTAVVLRILQVKSARARHAAWTAVVLLMLLLPAWMAWGAKASLRVLPATNAAAPGGSILFPAIAAPTSRASSYLQIHAPGRQPAQTWWNLLAGVYLLGLGVLLTRLAIGTARAHLLVRRAVIRENRLTSSCCAAPVTVGCLRPTVILPESWRDWPPAQLDAVLVHEHEHARRRDPLAQWLALLNRAVFWFHPLAWWLERRLSALAEEACDAAVLERGHDPIEYSEWLLELARNVLQTGARVQVLGMAMPGRALPRRIKRILEERPAPRISRVRMACVVAGCALLSTLFAAGKVDRRMPAPLAAAPLVMLQTPPSPVVPAPSVAKPSVAAEPQEQHNDRRMLVFYFDLRAMQEIDRARAFAAAQEFVRTRMRSSDLLAIMTAGDSVTVKQDISGDRDKLLQTLDQLKDDSAALSGLSVGVDQQLADLQTAVQMLGALQEKKAVMYFAAPTATANSGDLQRLIDAAIRAKVAFFMLDSQGAVPRLFEGRPQ
jgi:hypothetical protein